MSENILYSNAERFKADVLESVLPVLVDFYSEDCPPCSALAPMFERLAQKYGDKMLFVKVFRQENRKLAEELGVLSSPTLLFFNHGQETGSRLNGFIQKPDLRRAIEGVLGIKQEEVAKSLVEADLLILGGGPAGLTAALYAGRSKLKTVVVETGLPGGQAGNTYHIANYPGTEGVVRGSELVGRMLGQALSFGVRVDDFKEISSVSLAGSVKEIVAEDTIYHGRALIIATGARPRKLPAEGAQEWQGRGVHYCATCDGAMYEDQNVVVVGGGNSAAEEAVYLTRFAKHVTIIHEFDHLQATPTAQEEAFKNPKIDFVWQCHVQRVVADDRVSGVEVKHLASGETRVIPADGVFVYIGTEPDTGLFRGQVELTAQGYIRTDQEMRTGLPGVFAAGDVRDKEIRQVVAAAGDGAVAAVQAERSVVRR